MDCRVKPGNDDRFNMIGSRARPRNSNHCCWPAVRTTLLSALHRSYRFPKTPSRFSDPRRRIERNRFRPGEGVRGQMERLSNELASYDSRRQAPRLGSGKHYAIGLIAGRNMKLGSTL